MLCGFVGSIVSARANSFGTVIAGYCITGICFGAQPLLHAVVSEVLPREKRPLAQGSVNAVAGMGGFLGIVMGGALLRYGDLSHFRIYLYVTAGVCLAAAVGIAVAYNPPPRELQVSLSFSEKLRRLHWVSYVLFTPGLVLFCIALSWSRNPYSWSNAHIIAPFVVGVVFILAFIVYEWRFTKTGILNHGLFHTRNFPLALLTIFCEGIVFFTSNSYFAFEVGVVTGHDLLLSGLPYGVTFLSAMLVAGLVGPFSSRFKSLRVPIAVGFVLMMIFNICMASTYNKKLDGAYWGFAVILGAGIGLILPLVMVVAQLSTPPELISSASALVIAVRSLGGTVGLAINNAIFNSALSTEIPKRIAAAVLPLGLPPSSLGMLIGALAGNDQALLAHVPGATPQIIGAAAQALVQAYGIGFRNCWIAGCCFAAVAVVGKFTALPLYSSSSPSCSGITLLTTSSYPASIFLFDPKDQFTAHIDAPAEERIIEKQARLEGDSPTTTKHGARARDIDIEEKNLGGEVVERA